MIRPGRFEPEYFVDVEREEQRFEIAVGAVLTQNTAWSNAAKALGKLKKAGKLNPGSIIETDLNELAEIIRSSGYYNMKAKKLKALAEYFSSEKEITRGSLLDVYGIGPETADSIMLYACGEPLFIVDAYTRRIFSRTGLVDESLPYERIRKYFESQLPRDAGLYGEYHALIVEHAKNFCRSTPDCGECPLRDECGFRSA